MNFLGRLRILSYALVLLSITAFTMAEQNPALFILALLGLGLSWRLVDGPKGRPLPRWLINFGVLLASLLLFYELVLNDQGNGNLLFGLGHFMIAILMCKMFEAKGIRDYTQILTLSLLVIVAGAIFGTSLFFGLLLTLYFLLGVVGILFFFMHREQNKLLRTEMVVRPALTGTLAPAVKRDIRRILTTSTVGLALFASVIFMAMPRGNGHEFLAAWAAGRLLPLTGFSDHVRFGDFGALQQSNTVVMEVRIEQNGMPVGSGAMEPYFRGMTLDAYDGAHATWERSSRDESTTIAELPLDETVPMVFVHPNDSPPGKPPCYESKGMLRQHYTMHTAANVTNILFGIFPPVAITSPQIRAVTLDRRDLMLSYHGALGERFEYTVDSPLIYRDGVTHEPSRHWLESFFRWQEPASPNTPPSERIVQLAHKVAGELDPQTNPLNGDPQRTVQLCHRFEEYLRSNYPYSLQMIRVDRQIDPTEDFLFNRKKSGGHCEYFASSMIVLCRAVGMKARMVTGYHGGDYNQVGGFYVVRQKFAHAWVEVFVQDRGWVMFDPTPASAIEHADGNSWLRWFSEWSEYLQSKWLSGIVFFDNTARQQIVDFFRLTLWGNFVRFFGTAADYAYHFLRGLTDPDRPYQTTLLLGLLGLACGAWALERMAGQRRAAVARTLAHLDPAARAQLGKDLAFFGALLALLRRAGLRRSAAQTPRELAHRLEPVPARTDASWLVEQFYAIRFGTTRMTAALGLQVQQTLTSLRRKLDNN